MLEIIRYRQPNDTNYDVSETELQLHRMYVRSDSGFYVGGGRGRFATLFLQQVAANASAATDWLAEPKLSSTKKISS